MLAIEFINVSKVFAHGSQQLLGRVIAGQLLGWRQKRSDKDFQALRDISFAVEQGESLGIDRKSVV